jgi:hypothetical protein
MTIFKRALVEVLETGDTVVTPVMGEETEVSTT